MCLVVMQCTVRNMCCAKLAEVPGVVQTSPDVQVLGVGLKSLQKAAPPHSL